MGGGGALDLTCPRDTRVGVVQGVGPLAESFSPERSAERAAGGRVGGGVSLGGAPTATGAGRCGVVNVGSWPTKNSKELNKSL